MYTRMYIYITYLIPYMRIQHVCIYVCVYIRRYTPIDTNMCIYGLHRLGFRNLPNSIPGRGPAAIQEARSLMSCQNLTSVPYDVAGGHWDPLIVGSSEVMTPCVYANFYGTFCDSCMLESLPYVSLACVSEGSFDVTHAC